ncbi:hypothetical protein [Nocardioides marmotae]|uniref:Uncharacterized protein n=1 Tax=Nocardioides marmotae TaxID=2663857 RepID=A0A6I3JDY9_9ACTN|nr:hypothetical protein [Nocardioides marmotae]MCR6032641.1 hypothetical protein [Gordonia jinghuaiqii]MBC9732392.1 hypothetical protein [Nocardioides marmotae]MTB83512.1 hypothetical protein [Nocardioides marmotae]MTB96289.1 hypothetical protein [Nocardioides marmotae]QKE03221.1 hypothetical protein HPC71_20775 [Nocardioides marmotae]
MSPSLTGRDPAPDPREEEVRRRLTDARHVEPVPVDVAARLDRVLAQLAEGTDVPSSVTELERRRRRRAAGLLAAAAVVTVAGLGLAQVVPGSSGTDASTAADTSAGRDEPASASSAEDERAPSPQGSTDGGADADDGTSLTTDSLQAFAADRAPVRVRADHFATDALRARQVVDDAGERRSSGELAARDRRSGGAGSKAGGSQAGGRLFECTPADWGPGVAVPVRYDGEPHVLVFRAPAGDSQVADLLQCGTGVILRSTTLPAG